MTKSMDKIKYRYYNYRNNPSVTAIRVDDLKLTKKVKKFLKDHNMTVKGDSAYFPKDEKLRRLGANFSKCDTKKKYSVRGY